MIMVLLFHCFSYFYVVYSLTFSPSITTQMLSALNVSFPPLTITKRRPAGAAKHVLKIHQTVTLTGKKEQDVTHCV